MQKNRLEAFSDGVLAIIITIMVLELKVPHEVELSALKPMLPLFLSYLLGFIYIWFIPDRRIERVLEKREQSEDAKD